MDTSLYPDFRQGRTLTFAPGDRSRAAVNLGVVKRLRRESRRQIVLDVLLWALLSVAIAASGPDPLRDPAAFCLESVPKIALAALAVLLGRPWPPLAVLLLLPVGPWRFDEGLATSTIVWPVRLPGVKIFPFSATTPFVIWFVYLSGRRPVRAGPAAAVFCAVVLLGAAVVLARGGGLALWISMVSGLLLTYALPYSLGVVRRKLVRQQRESRLSAAERARLRERARIAREMHDSLGHDLALIAVRAAGLELAPGLGDKQVRAAGELRVAAADATERLRQIIGLLRDDADAAPLTPVHEDVPDLVERARDSGMTITLTLPAGEVPALAHAVVQEGLTNAAKHAPGAAVEVEISPHRVGVRNGPPRSRPTATPGGLGLAALTERVRLAGGTLTAGPSGDGYELVAKLPGIRPGVR